MASDLEHFVHGLYSTEPQHKLAERDLEHLSLRELEVILGLEPQDPTAAEKLAFLGFGKKKEEPEIWQQFGYKSDQQYADTVHKHLYGAYAKNAPKFTVRHPSGHQDHYAVDTQGAMLVKSTDPRVKKASATASGQEKTALLGEMLVAPIQGHLVDIRPGAPASFNMGTKRVTVGDLDPNALAHELGHAELDRSLPGRLLQNPLTTMSGMLAPTAGGVVGGVSGYRDAMEEGPEDKRPNRLRRDALLGAAAHAPMLAYEGGASLKGMRMLKEMGAGPEDLRRARHALGRAWGTYAMLPVATTINYGAGRAIGKAIGTSKRKQQKKTSGADYTTPLDIPKRGPIDLIEHLSAHEDTRKAYNGWIKNKGQKPPWAAQFEADDRSFRKQLTKKAGSAKIADASGLLKQIAARRPPPIPVSAIRSASTNQAGLDAVRQGLARKPPPIPAAARRPQMTKHAPLTPQGAARRAERQAWMSKLETAMGSGA
jgi:hypothetical protein